jgi:hypothetical protein
MAERAFALIRVGLKAASAVIEVSEVSEVSG